MRVLFHRIEGRYVKGGQTKGLNRDKLWSMERKSISKVVWADRFAGGLVITFEDERCAVYSPDLLLSVFEQAAQVIELDDDQSASV